MRLQFGAQFNPSESITPDVSPTEENPLWSDAYEQGSGLPRRHRQRRTAGGGTELPESVLAAFRSLAEQVQIPSAEANTNRLRNMITSLNPVGPIVLTPEMADRAEIERTPSAARRRILTLITQLSSANFQERQAAEIELVNTFGTTALPFLREVLRHPPTEEMRQSAERLIRRIMGADSQTWWNGLCRDGSGRITAVMFADQQIVQTLISWNGLNEISSLQMYHPTDSEGTLTNRDFGEGLSFIRTPSGYQVTRLDGGPLAPHLQLAIQVTVNDYGVITVVWANGTITGFRPTILLRTPNGPT